MRKVMINLGMILFSLGMLVIPARANSEKEKKLTEEIDKKLKLYSDKSGFSQPPISLILRMTTPDLVEKVENIYFSALDYQFLSLRSLRYAKEFSNEGKTSKANEYLEKADRYYKLATSLQGDSLAVLDSTISAAQWTVVYKASRTALGFATTGLGVGPSTIFDAGTLYTDYALDKSMMPLEEAKKNLIAKAISRTLLQFTGTSELVGDTVKHGWGSSGAFPALQKIIGSSEFKDAALKEFMRLGGDLGDYAAKLALEEGLSRTIKAAVAEKDTTLSAGQIKKTSEKVSSLEEVLGLEEVLSPEEFLSPEANDLTSSPPKEILLTFGQSLNFWKVEHSNPWYWLDVNEQEVKIERITEFAITFEKVLEEINEQSWTGEKIKIKRIKIYYQIENLGPKRAFPEMSDLEIKVKDGNDFDYYRLGGKVWVEALDPGQTKEGILISSQMPAEVTPLEITGRLAGILVRGTYYYAKRFRLK